MKRYIKVLVIAIVLIVLIIPASLIISEALEISKDLKKVAELKNLTSDSIDFNFKKGYTSLNYHTSIDMFEWSFVNKPIYKINEHNPFEDYWIIDENKTVIANLYGCIGTSDKKIYIKDEDIDKIPTDYNQTEKISKVSVYSAKGDTLTVDLDLTANEISELEEIAFSVKREPLDLDIDYPSNGEIWYLQFHIKDMEYLYYHTGKVLAKSDTGKYYAVNGYAYAYCEIPESIGRKIDNATAEIFVNS